MYTHVIHHSTCVFDIEICTYYQSMISMCIHVISYSVFRHIELDNRKDMNIEKIIIKKLL